MARSRSGRSTVVDDVRVVEHQTPKLRPGRPRSEEAREAILRATLDLLERQGVAGLTIEGIATEAGVAKATIYRWWPSRIAVALEAMERLPPLEVPDLGSFPAEVRALVRSFAELLTTTPLGGVLAQLAVEGPERAPEVQTYMARRSGGPVEVIRRAIARGELPHDVDPDAIVCVALGPVLARTYYTRHCDDAFLDFVAAAVVASLPGASQQQPATSRVAARR